MPVPITMTQNSPLFPNCSISRKEPNMAITSNNLVLSKLSSNTMVRFFVLRKFFLSKNLPITLQLCPFYAPVRIMPERHLLCLKNSRHILLGPIGHLMHAKILMGLRLRSLTIPTLFHLTKMGPIKTTFPHNPNAVPSHQDGPNKDYVPSQSQRCSISPRWAQ